MASKSVKEDINMTENENIVNDENIDSVVKENENDISKKKKKDKKENELTELKTKIINLEEKLLRERAEVENFKRRTNEEKIKNRKFASLNLVTDFINILDSLDRAVNFEVSDEKIKNFLTGFKMINNQLFEVLESDGLKKIESVNQKYDPNLHHAVIQEVVEDKEDGIILEELQRGYTYKERVIRPSMVKINDKNKEMNDNE